MFRCLEERQGYLSVSEFGSGFEQPLVLFQGCVEVEEVLDTRFYVNARE